MIWLSKRAVLMLHQRAINQYGGLNIGANEAPLEATLARPQQLINYKPDSSIPELAASYGYGFARNHCFSDGNKRVAFYCVATFLEVNGYIFDASEVEVVQIFEGLADGTVNEGDLLKWIQQNIEAVDK